jgi:hypothetical protein
VQQQPQAVLPAAAETWPQWLAGWMRPQWRLRMPRSKVCIRTRSQLRLTVGMLGFRRE